MAKKDMNKDKKNNNFFKELKSELKKVTWPTFKKLVNNTSAVIAVVLIVSIIVFILDVCFENLNDFGVGKIKSLVSSDTEETTDLGDGIELNTDDTTESEDASTEEVVEDAANTGETATNSEEVPADNNSEEVTQ